MTAFCAKSVEIAMTDVDNLVRMATRFGRGQPFLINNGMNRGFTCFGQTA